MADPKHDALNPDEAANEENGEGPFLETDPRASTVPAEEMYLENQYCKTVDGSEKYAKDSEGNEYMCGDKYVVNRMTNMDNQVEEYEILPRKQDGTEIYLEKDGVKIHPSNLTTGRVLLPMDQNGHEEKYDVNDKGEEIYPTKSDGGQGYRRDSRKREVPIIGKGYAIDNEQNQMYPKDDKGTERYLVSLTDLEQPMEYGAMTYGDFSNFYAKNSKGDEYYPKKYKSYRNFVLPYWMTKEDLEKRKLLP